SRPELEHPYVSPRNAIEKELTSIWSEVLRKERVGIKDNFFEMSQSTTVASLAAAVVELQNNTKPAAGPIISRRRGVSAKIEQLSPEEVDSLLGEVLSQADLKQ